MNNIPISRPKLVRNSYWGLFLVAIITMLSDGGGYLGQGKMVFFLWVMFVGGIMYILTSSIKQRLIWWIALAPFALRGPHFLNIGIGVTSIIACFIIVEFLILNTKKIHLDYRIFTSELTFPFLMLIAALISILFSPIASPKPGPLLRFCLIIAIYSIAFIIFNQKEDVLLITKAIGFQLIMYLVYLVSEYYIKGGFVLFDNRLIGSNVTVHMIVLSSPFLCLFKVVQRRNFFPLIIMTCVILVILTMSRCGYLIMIIDSILLVTFYSQKLKKNEGLWLGVFFLISPIVGIITYNVYAKYIMPFRDTSNFERIVAARSAYEGFLKYPLTGIGFGQWINSHEVVVCFC